MKIVRVRARANGAKLGMSAKLKEVVCVRPLQGHTDTLDGYTFIGKREYIIAIKKN